MNDDVPEGWAEVNVAAVASDISYGLTAKSSASTVGPKYLRITDIQHGVVDWASVPHCRVPPDKKSAYGLLPGDVVFARTGATTGKSYLITDCPDGVFASYLIRVRPSSAVLADFLYLFFQSHSYWTQISENISGSAQPNCNASKLSALTISLPPVEEQHRIVAAAAHILAKVRPSHERLNKLPITLKRFRRAVITAACNGRLTADWRTKPDTSGVGGLPPAWREDTVAGVCDSVVDCPHSTPKWKSAGYVCVKTTEVRAGKLDLSSPFYVSSETYKERTQRLRPRAGDILYCREGLVGAACIVPAGVDLCLGQRLMLMRASNEIAPAFLMHALNSELILAQARDRTLGTTAQHVNVGDVKRFRLLIPPLAEQHEIVRRVESMFALADRLEARYEKVKAQVDKLTQAILAKAFRGELVPTEAELARREGRSYETAEELLKRVRESASKKSGQKRFALFG